MVNSQIIQKISVDIVKELSDDIVRDVNAMFGRKADSLAPKLYDINSGDGPYYVICSDNGGKIVGFRAFKPYVFSDFVSGEIYAYQACETVTDFSWRGKGLFGLMWDCVRVELSKQSDFVFNFPNKLSFKPYIKSGFDIHSYMHGVFFSKGQRSAELKENQFIWMSQSDLVSKEKDYQRVTLTKSRVSNLFPVYVPSYNNMRKHDLCFDGLYGIVYGNSLLISLLKSDEYSIGPIVTSRPITYFPFNKSVYEKKILISLSELDTFYEEYCVVS